MTQETTETSNKSTQITTLVEELDELFAKHLPHFYDASEKPRNELTPEEKQKIVYGLKFNIAVQSAEAYLRQADEIVRATPIGDEITNQFGLLCSRTFLNSAYTTLMNVLREERHDDYELWLNSLGTSLAEIKLSEQALLDTMNASIPLVEDLKLRLQAISKFALAEIPEEFTTTN